MCVHEMRIEAWHVIYPFSSTIGIHIDVCPRFFQTFVTASQAEELWHTSCCWHGTRGAGKTPVPGTGTSTSCVVRCSLRGPAELLWNMPLESKEQFPINRIPSCSTGWFEGCRDAPNPHLSGWRLVCDGRQLLLSCSVVDLAWWGRFHHFCVKVWQCRWCRTHWRRILHVPWGWNTLQMPWRCDAKGKREWVQSWGLRVQLAMFVIDSEKGLSQLKRNL